MLHLDVLLQTGALMPRRSTRKATAGRDGGRVRPRAVFTEDLFPSEWCVSDIPNICLSQVQPGIHRQANHTGDFAPNFFFFLGKIYIKMQR